MMYALAVIVVRNEAVYIGRCIDHLLGQGLKVAVIDNDSTDGTVDVCRRYAPHDVVYVERVPYSGHFDLRILLERVAALSARLPARWIVRSDADEILQSPVPGERLADSLARVEAAGFNAVNFDEFVFIPEDARAAYERTDYVAAMRSYYFFQPSTPRLMRAWINRPDVSMVRSGGHLLEGPSVRLCPEPFVLRHYICLSLAHARTKYLNRRYALENVARGWHGNRVAITADNLRLPPPHALKKLNGAGFDRGEPWTVHFWQRDWQPVATR